jgi:hypothetical protein
MLRLLTTKHDYPPPRNWSGITPWNWRHVYEGQGVEWGITHSGDIPADQKPYLTARDVLPLYDAGLLASDYPNTRAAMASFHITDAGRAALSRLGE